MIRRNFFSILAAIIIAYMSLSSSDSFSRLSFLSFPGADKVIHFLMYFGFMSVIALENRKSFGKPSILFLAGIVPLIYGIIMEALQLWITQSRSGSLADIIFNAAGILVSVLIFLSVKPLRKRVIR